VDMNGGMIMAVDRRSDYGAGRSDSERATCNSEVDYYKRLLAEQGITTDGELRKRFKEPGIHPLYLGLLRAREAQSGVCFSDPDGF